MSSDLTQDVCNYRGVGLGNSEPECRPGLRYDTAMEVAYMAYCPHCGRPIHVPEDAAAEDHTYDEPQKDPAADLLLDALTIVTGARQQAYGTPEDNFSKIAALWRAYLEMRFPGVPTPGLSPTDVALMMALMKVARLAESPEHKDSWQDLAGYAACGWRCASRNAPEEPAP